MSRPMNITCSTADRDASADGSEDSGVDVSAVTAGDNSGRGPYIKRPWLDDGASDMPNAKLKIGATASVEKSARFPSAIGFPPVPEPLDLSGHGQTRTVPPSEPVPYSTWCTICCDFVAPPNPRDLQVVPNSCDLALLNNSDLQVVPNSRDLALPNARNPRVPPSVPFNVTSSVVGESRRQYKGRMMANARERIRSRTINEAFDVLRANIPKPVGYQKMSKLMTIELATAYINRLTRELNERYRGNWNALPTIANKPRGPNEFP